MVVVLVVFRKYWKACPKEVWNVAVSGYCDNVRIRQPGTRQTAILNNSFSMGSLFNIMLYIVAGVGSPIATS